MVFRVGSITKTFTAVAVMQLVESGLIDLDEPAAAYLTEYRLTPWRSDHPPTVRYLLTHTAGVPEIVHPTGLARRLFGETVPTGAAIPSLSDYYPGELRTFGAPAPSSPTATTTSPPSYRSSRTSPGPPAPGPARPEVRHDLCGWYSVRGRLTDIRAAG